MRTPARVPLPLEDRVVIREEGPELVGAVRQRQEDVGDEARLLLHPLDRLANVGRQIAKLRNGLARDRLHDGSSWLAPG